MKKFLPAAIAMVAVVVGAAASPARAQAGPAGIDWKSPDGCPSRADIVQRTQHIMGTATVSTSVAASVTVSNDEGGWRAAIRLAHLGEEPSTREVRGESCEAIADAVTLILAVALDQDERKVAPAPPPPSAIFERPRLPEAYDETFLRGCFVLPWQWRVAPNRRGAFRIRRMAAGSISARFGDRHLRKGSRNDRGSS